MSSEEKKKEEKLREVFLGGEVKEVPLTTAAEPATPTSKAKKGEKNK